MSCNKYLHMRGCIFEYNFWSKSLGIETWAANRYNQKSYF